MGFSAAENGIVRTERGEQMMPDMDTTKRMFTHMLNMMEQHDTMTISCGDPLMKLLKDVRELLNEQPEIVLCKDCMYWKEEQARSMQTKWLPCMEVQTNKNWFCADGERRDDDA
jgi:hypothetical protein